MAAMLEGMVDKVVQVVTNDGRNIVGLLKGFDQTTNIILDECHERVFSSEAGVEQVQLGLYIVRGDNMCAPPLLTSHPPRTCTETLCCSTYDLCTRPSRRLSPAATSVRTRGARPAHAFPARRAVRWLARWTRRRTGTWTGQASSPSHSSRLCTDLHQRPRGSTVAAQRVGRPRGTAGRLTFCPSRVGSVVWRATEHASDARRPPRSFLAGLNCQNCIWSRCETNGTT